MIVARVLPDVTARALDRAFDYLVPDSLASEVGVGAPVLVQLGRQDAVAYVLELAGESAFELKPVRAVLGPPLFDEASVALARWIASEYLCALMDALRLFLPPGGTPAVVRTLRATGPRPESGLRADVYDAVAAGANRAAGVRARFGGASDAAVAALVATRALARDYTLSKPSAGPVDDRWLSLGRAPESGELRANATAQRAVVDALAAGPLSAAELIAELGNVDAAIRRLTDLGIVRVERHRRYRRPGGGIGFAPRHERLSDGQHAALRAIGDAASGDVVLLDGVTGSGKTEVYLRAIEQVIADGNTAIVLVPEISLTPQAVGRFRSRFGDRVAVLHSRLSAGERYDQWELAATGEVSVVVGPRSALFAPIARVRLIVIDEEHEPTYKQGGAPRYHAREVAERMCTQRGAVLVLGSATPSMEARYAADTGRWRRVLLPERVSGAVPEVRVVDMAAEFAAGHRSMFSRALLEALGEIDARGEKAVLFLNRRGFASFLLCRECGFVPGCDSCSVSLTYHQTGRRLACHHCGLTREVPSACPRCGSPYLRQFGAGTQRVSSELTAAFPELPVIRMDADTTHAKGAHERLLASFEALPRGVLLGTQMVAKGLDFPEVTLVGVVNADTTLHLPDFRSGERTYQLLEQVAGRAGRGAKPGRVIVQTYWPDNAAIRAVAAHDAELFYAEEREVRAALRYPPYGRLANVLVSGADERAVRDQTRDAGERLRADTPEGFEVLGPSPAPLARVKGAWRWHLLVKAPREADVPEFIRGALAGVAPAEGLTMAVDVDPVDVL